MLMPLQHTKRDEQAKLAQVYVTSGLYQAEIVRGKLETNGIPVLLKYESLGPIMGLTVDGLGQVEVWVPFDFEDAARELLSDDDALTDEEAGDDPGEISSL